MNQKKNERITFRLDADQYETILKRAAKADMSVGTYVRSAALKHKIIVVEGLPEITHELKAIGRNLNQLTTLANMGRITVVGLDSVKEQLYDVYGQIGALMQEEQR